MITQSFRLHCALAAAALGITALSASSFAASATLTHDYELNNSLADSKGGPDLTNNGATLGATGLTFAANQGPSGSSLFSNTSEYSIELEASLDSTSGYRKIIDFFNLANDAGLYNLNSTLDFFPITSTGTITPGTPYNIILTRDASSKVVVAYLDGVQQFTFIDTSNLAVFSGPSGIANFFIDDNATGQREATSGFLDFIHIYDGVLTDDQAKILGDGGSIDGGGVPEPASLSLLAIGASTLLLRKRRTH